MKINRKIMIIFKKIMKNIKKKKNSNYLIWCVLTFGAFLKFYQYYFFSKKYIWKKNAPLDQTDLSVCSDGAFFFLNIFFRKKIISVKF